MSQLKHTPGPWEVHQEVEGRNSVRVCKRDDSERGCRALGEAEILGVSRLEAEANARLIAAAPDLIETVIAYKLHHKMMMQIADDVDCPCKICQLAEAVIRKAESEA